MAARDLDEDPEQTSITALQFLGYAHAKAEYDAAEGEEKRLEHWKDHPTMETVRDNTFKAMKARLDHRKEHPKGGEPHCRLCLSKR